MENNQTPKEPLGRRKSSRVPLRIGATVNAGGTPLRGRLVNLSQGGALFEFSQKRSILPGPCTLQVTLSDAANRPLSIPIDIVRAAYGQFGVEWRQPLPEDVGALQFLLKG